MNESMNRKGRNSNAETMQSMNPVSMLKEDHSNVKKLFDQFEGTEDEQTQMEIAKKALDELRVHSAIEEEIFYPGVEATVDDTEVMCEATQEHHVVHLLIDELESQDLDHDTFHAKFIVLAENVRHHIKEEEGEMLPKVDGDESEIQELGAQMAERKQQLMENPDALNKKTSRRTSAGQVSQSSQGRTAKKGTTGSTRSTSRSTSAKDGNSSTTKKSSRSGSRSSSPRASR